MLNSAYTEQLVKDFKEYKSYRLIPDQQAKILNKDAYVDYVDWATRVKNNFIPPYILFCRLSVTYIKWFKYRSTGKTHFVGYRLATEDETRALIAAAKEAKEMNIKKPIANTHPAWMEEERQRATRERMENFAKVKAMRLAKGL